MSTTVSITKSIDVDIELVSTPRGPAIIAETGGGEEVARATVYQSDDRPDGTARFTVTGNFVDNYAVESKAARAYPTASFDSEMGQFFAYERGLDAALQLARIVVTAAVEVALERGEL